MVFSYKELTISGSSDPSVEGSSKLIQEIKDCLVNEMGWALTEDRSDQAGSNHKVILQSNGELSNKPTFYMVMTSGTTDEVGFQLATFWDTGTHTVGSGVANPSSEITATLETLESGDYSAWISGDQDGVAFISHNGSSYDLVYVGNVYQFTNPSYDPFPMVIVGTSVGSFDIIDGTASYSFLDQTTLSTSENHTEGLFTSPVSVDSHPNNVFGQTEGYVALPVFSHIDLDANNKAIRGILPNIWTTIGPNAAGSTLTVLDELDTGDGRVYKVFFSSGTSSTATVVRKS